MFTNALLVCLLFFPLYILWLCYMGLWRVICFACQHAPCFTASVVLFGGWCFLAGGAFWWVVHFCWCCFEIMSLLHGAVCVHCAGYLPFRKTYTPCLNVGGFCNPAFARHPWSLGGFHCESFLGQYPVAFYKGYQRGFFLFCLERLRAIHHSSFEGSLRRRI